MIVIVMHRCRSFLLFFSGYGACGGHVEPGSGFPIGRFEGCGFLFCRSSSECLQACRRVRQQRLSRHWRACRGGREAWDRGRLITCTLATAIMDEGIPTYECTRAVCAPAMDGRVEGTAWDRAEWTRDFQHILGNSRGEKPYFRTRCKMRKLQVRLATGVCTTCLHIR